MRLRADCLDQSAPVSLHSSTQGADIKLLIGTDKDGN